MQIRYPFPNGQSTDIVMPLPSLPPAAGHGPVAPHEVALVTLTYGDRAELLAQCLEGVRREGMRRALVLANGLAPEPMERTRAVLEAAREAGMEIDLIESAVNLGSAAGYGRLVEMAQGDPRLRAIWFLDDDNVPRPGALARLLEAAATDPGAAVCAVRTDRTYLIRAAETGRAIPPAPGEAFGVDVLKRPRRLWLKLTRTAPNPVPTAVAVPRVPYGGLLVPSETYGRVAPPRADFVIYGDDYDYSGRLAAAAGLYLVGAARIDDLEASWNATGAAAAGPRTQTGKLAAMPADFRLYYAVRNTLFLDRGRVGFWTWPLFAVNLLLLASLVGGRALAAGRRDTARVLLRAMRDGVFGRMGRIEAFPLP